MNLNLQTRTNYPKFDVRFVKFIRAVKDLQILTIKTLTYEIMRVINSGKLNIQLVLKLDKITSGKIIQQT